MMIFLLAFTATLLGGFVCPWWWPAVVGVVLGFWKAGRHSRTFTFSALGSGLAWGVVATFYQLGNHGLLAGKVAAIFHVPSGGYGSLLILVTAMLGGLTAGFGTLLGRGLAPRYKL